MGRKNKFEEKKQEVLKLLKKQHYPISKIAFFINSNIYRATEIIQELSDEGKVESFNVGSRIHWRLR